MTMKVVLSLFEEQCICCANNEITVVITFVSQFRRDIWMVLSRCHSYRWGKDNFQSEKYALQNQRNFIIDSDNEKCLQILQNICREPSLIYFDYWCQFQLSINLIPHLLIFQSKPLWYFPSNLRNSKSPANGELWKIGLDSLSKTQHLSSKTHKPLL